MPALTPAVAAVLLLTGPEPRREGDWILLRVPPCRHADRALRATARLASAAVGARVRLLGGGLLCGEAADRVAEWLRSAPLAEAMRAALPPQPGIELLECDERGVPAPGRWCGLSVGGAAVHFSPRPNPEALAAAFALRPGAGVRRSAREAEAAAVFAAHAGGDAAARWRVRAAAALLRSGGERPPQPPRALALPVYASLDALRRSVT